MTPDPFASFKVAQREGWALFAPLESLTTPAAATLVEFAGIAAHQSVLDVACGTGVAAISAAPATTRLRWSAKSTFASSQILTPLSAISP